eukprot:g2599.t1
MSENYDDDAFETDSILSSLPSIKDRGDGHAAGFGMSAKQFAVHQDESRRMVAFEAKFAKLRKKAKEIVLELDESGNGKIEKKELPAILEKLGIQMDKEKLKALSNEIFREVDLDGDGHLSFDEFFHLYESIVADEEGLSNLVEKTQKKLSKKMKKEAKKCFDQYDKDGSGYISANELTKLVKDLGFEKKGLSGKQVDDLVKHIITVGDEDSDGTIDFYEFLRFFRKCLSSKAKRKKWREKALSRYATACPEMAFLSGI